jgi:hypothetical protein
MASTKKQAKQAKAAKQAKKAKAAKAVTPPEQLETFLFCRHDKVRYVPESTTWMQFRAATCELLRFHAQALPPEALATEIELFATRLDKYLLAIGFAGKEGARYATRGAVGEVQAPMQGLLDAVDDNYRLL